MRSEDGRLFAQSAGDPKFELFPISENTFMAKVSDAGVTFVKDMQGKVTELFVYFGGRNPHFKKIK